MNDQMELFLKVERGELSAEEAARRLEEIQNSAGDLFTSEAVVEPVTVEEVPAHSRTSEVRSFEHLTRWWVLPFVFGVLITAMGAFWMYLGWNQGDPLFGFWLAWLPFIIGVVVMALSWRARASHWLHIQINQKPGSKQRNFTLSIPLPLGLVKWANLTFGQHFPPEIRGVDLDDLIDSIEESVTMENPIYVWAEEEQQQVEIWIGRGVE